MPATIPEDASARCVQNFALAAFTMFVASVCHAEFEDGSARLNDGRWGDGAAQGQVALSRSILPGVAMAAILIAGIGVFAYQSWREAHPLPQVPEDVEPQLKQPGVVPEAMRKAS